MGTFLVLLLTAVVVAIGAGVALLPALLVIGAVAFAIWLVTTILGVAFQVIGGLLGLVFSLAFGAMALLFGFVLLPLVFPMLLLFGIVYLVSRSNHAAAPRTANGSA